MHGPSISFEPEGKKWPSSAGRTILEIAREAGVDLQSGCAGKGSCGKCRVIICGNRNALCPITTLEEILFSKEEIAQGYRLACRASIAALCSITVEVPDESRLGQQRLLSTGVDIQTRPKPIIKKVTVKLREPSLADTRSDCDRLIDSLEEEGIDIEKIGVKSLRRMPEILRKEDWVVTAAVRNGGEVIWLESGKTSEKNYGLALDIGTTKLAAYLVNLNTGVTFGTASSINPQIKYGEDVITRISAIMDDSANLKNLQRVVVHAVNELIDDLCVKGSINRKDIYDVSMVGNTVMHHIFLGISPKYVALSPYPAIVRASINVDASDLGLKINPAAYVYALPNVAGFVGADAVADILSTRMDESALLSMLIDLGTNSEIILGDRNGLICCSSPSGPAWEGAHIQHGMRAGNGAIESVWIDPETLEPAYEVIGKTRPSGICGSGVVDLVAEMLKSHIIDFNGLIDGKIKSSRIRKKRHREYVIVWGSESVSGKDIAFTQEDIREVQLAKAAIFAGVAILMKKAECRLANLQRLLIAGAFGTYVDVHSAKIIGLFPDIPTNRIQFVGNAAGSGARMALISDDERKKADSIAGKMRKRIELGTDADFQNEFLNATKFPHSKIDLFPNVRRILKT